MLGIDIFKPHKKIANEKPRLIGRKPPLKLKEIWAIRVALHVSGRRRDLALFNLAIDSKLRACDLVTLRVGCLSIWAGGGTRKCDAAKDEAAGTV